MLPKPSWFGLNLFSSLILPLTGKYFVCVCGKYFVCVCVASILFVCVWQVFCVCVCVWQVFCVCVCVRARTRSVMSDSLWPHGLQPTRLLSPWDHPSKNTGVSCYFLLQRVFLTQGLNPCLLYCTRILLQLSHWGSTSCQNIFLHLTYHQCCEAFLAPIDKLPHTLCVFLVPPLTLAIFYCTYFSKCIFHCHFYQCVCVYIHPPLHCELETQE